MTEISAPIIRKYEKVSTKVVPMPQEDQVSMVAAKAVSGVAALTTPPPIPQKTAQQKHQRKEMEGIQRSEGTEGKRYNWTKEPEKIERETHVVRNVAIGALLILGIAMAILAHRYLVH